MTYFATGLPKNRAINNLFFSVAYTDTTAVQKATLPKGAYVVGAYVIGGAASGAVTSAVINVGTTATATELVASYDVKTAATGEGFNIVGGAAVGSAFATKLTAEKPVYVKYTGVGGSDSGSWTIRLEYVILGPGETL